VLALKWQQFSWIYSYIKSSNLYLLSRSGDVLYCASIISCGQGRSWFTI
jgi:hypothetical protein